MLYVCSPRCLLKSITLFLLASYVSSPASRTDEPHVQTTSYRRVVHARSTVADGCSYTVPGQETTSLSFRGSSFEIAPKSSVNALLRCRSEMGITAHNTAFPAVIHIRKFPVDATNFVYVCGFIELCSTRLISLACVQVLSSRIAVMSIGVYSSAWCGLREFPTSGGDERNWVLRCADWL